MLEGVWYIETASANLKRRPDNAKNQTQIRRRRARRQNHTRGRKCRQEGGVKMPRTRRQMTAAQTAQTELTLRTLKYPDAPLPPQGTTPVATAKANRKDAGIILVSIEERALVARFVRLIRSNYWLSFFIKQILRLDSDSPQMVPISKVQDQLKQMEDLEDLVQRIQFVGKNGWWRDHPAVAAIAEEWDEVYEYKSDAAICKLIESAKEAAKK